MSKFYDENNVRFINQLDKLLKQKEEDYGSFDKTSWVMTQLLENILTAHNGVKVKVSIKTFGILDCIYCVDAWIDTDNPLHIKY